MHQQWHAQLGHLFQGCITAADVGDAGSGVGGGPGRIEFHRMHQAALFCLDDLIRRGVIGQIEGHEGFERHAIGDSL